MCFLSIDIDLCIVDRNHRQRWYIDGMALKVLISGAGVAGLALAGFLKKHTDVEFDLIDRSQGFGHLGYAIIIWPLGARILNKLELSPLIAKKAEQLTKIIVTDSLGKTLDIQELTWARKEHGDIYTISRDHLHSSLEQLVPSRKIKFGTVVESIRQNKEGARVVFNDGTEKEYDLVVSADGVGSKIREMIFGVTASFYEFSVWISWLKKNPNFPKNPRFIVGTNAHITFFPVKGEREVAYFFVKRNPDLVDVELNKIEYLQEVYEDFEGLGKEIISHLDSQPARIYQDHMRKVDMDDWSLGRVALMGDAEHAMSPVTGMGSSLALEDAFVLYDELLAISFDSEKVGQALKRFAERRQPRVSEIERFSDLLMNLSVDNQVVTSVRNTLLKTDTASSFLTSAIKKVLDWNI